MLDSWVVHAYFCRWTCVKDMCVAAIADCGFNMITCPSPVGFQAVLDEFDRENRGEAAEEEAMQERSAAAVQHSIFLSAFCSLRFSLSPPFPFSPCCCRQSMDHFKPWCLSFQLAVFHQVESLSFLWKPVIIDGGNISTYYTLTYWIDIIWVCLKMRCTTQIIGNIELDD